MMMRINNMKEYIEREAVFKELDSLKADIKLAMLGVYKAVDVSPAADVAPVVHGKWNVGSIGVHCYCECSICKQETLAGMRTKYCPNCGAKMDGGNK